MGENIELMVSSLRRKKIIRNKCVYLSKYCLMQKGIERNEHIKEKKDCREMSGKGVRVGTKKKKNKIIEERQTEEKMQRAKATQNCGIQPSLKPHKRASYLLFLSLLLFSSPFLLSFVFFFFFEGRGVFFFPSV